MSERFPAMSFREFTAVLETFGWTFAHWGGKGSHAMFVKEGESLTIPDHGKSMAKGTMQGILSDAGIPRKEFKWVLTSFR